MVEMREVLANPESFHAQLQQIGGDKAPTEAPITTENEPKNETTENSDPQNEVEARETEEVESTEDAPESHGKSDPENTSSSNEDDYKNGKFIPKSRFNQEIEKRKGIEEQWLKEREEKIRLEEQLKMFTHLQHQANGHNSSPVERSLDLDHVDPLDAETHNVYSREIKQLKEELRNTSHQTKQMQYASIVSSQETSFQKSNPDYLDAANYLKNIELSGARAMFGDDRAAEQVVVQKYNQLMSKSLETGKNVPETIYKLAEAYGYKSDPKEAKTKEGGSNLKAINSNMKKSASVSGLGNSVGFGGSPRDISSALKDPSNPRSGFDPKKFQQMLHKAG